MHITHSNLGKTRGFMCIGCEAVRVKGALSPSVAVTRQQHVVASGGQAAGKNQHVILRLASINQSIDPIYYKLFFSSAKTITDS